MKIKFVSIMKFYLSGTNLFEDAKTPREALYTKEFLLKLFFTNLRIGRKRQPGNETAFMDQSSGQPSSTSRRGD